MDALIPFYNLRMDMSFMKPNLPRPEAALILEDGAFFRGELLGHLEGASVCGEVVFNTAMAGYQEIITDPSYKGQFVCFTYPSIGNYGYNKDDIESDRPRLKGILIRDYCEVPSNFRSMGTLEEYLIENNLPGMTGIDTRRLVRHIREKGAMRGGIFLPPKGLTENQFSDWLSEQVKEVLASPSIEGADLTQEFDGRNLQSWLESQKPADSDRWPKVAVLDFGVKWSILRYFLEEEIMPIVFAGSKPLSEQPNFRPEEYAGYFISNGPGDPAAVEVGIENIKKLLEDKKPIFGICLGHQMLSLALGAKTRKMKFGHHGGNQPVKERDDEAHRVIITSQNHGFAVVEDSLTEALRNFQNVKWERNPNDNSVEGFRIADSDKKIISVQYHPEAAPGPHDARPIFHDFRNLLSR